MTLPSFRSAAKSRSLPRGEFELPNAVRLAIQKGMKFKAATCRAGVLDLSRRSDIAAVAERLKDVQVRL